MLLFSLTPLSTPHSFTHTPLSAHQGKLRVETVLQDSEIHWVCSKWKGNIIPTVNHFWLLEDDASFRSWHLEKKERERERETIKIWHLFSFILPLPKPQKHNQGFLSKSVLLGGGGTVKSGSNLASNNSSIKTQIPSVSTWEVLQNPKTSYFLFLFLFF